MPIMLYNTAHRRKEVFHPLFEGRVGMYVCGVTVYDYCHIGHARSAIVFDVLAKYLRARGYELTYVRNFTDVDDKIIDRARQLGKDPADLAQEFIDAFEEDMARLGVGKADREPRATEHIGDMIRMIEILMEKGFAYESDGDVFFSVEAFQDYGGLSGRKLEEMKAGSRIAVDRKKRHPMDFALWKSAKPGEPCWESPWGPGRPGWHMECSVMSNRFLGPTFDIHGGGRDLLFPHHENERAQSMAANGADFARYWVHNGFVTVESEKMSKSLGNFLTIRDALGAYHPEVLRLFLLSKHYRSPLDFSRDAVRDLQAGLVRIYRTLQRLEERIGPEPAAGTGEPGALSGNPEDPFLTQFVSLMDDDLNTAAATGLIFEKVKELNRRMDAIDSGDEVREDELVDERSRLLLAARVLGLLNHPPAEFLESLARPAGEPDAERIDRLVAERTEARSRKEWQRADEIRDELQKEGVILEDGPGGTAWRYEIR
ncbi:MAG: cysteine--tRNA ligase [Deltaproteobacteria bacterium]|nr:cysteine--tRNA ligase [Deltaproteobacteria bacterium]